MEEKVIVESEKKSVEDTIDYSKLPTYEVTLSANENSRTGMSNYRLVLKLLPRGGLTCNIVAHRKQRITEVQFYSWKFALGLNTDYPTSTAYKVPVLFGRATRKDGSIFHLARLIIYKNKEDRAKNPTYYFRDDQFDLYEQFVKAKKIRSIEWIDLTPEDVDESDGASELAEEE